MANKNSDLNWARKAKKDEFYTQLSDIEKGIGDCLLASPQMLKGKTVLLPADDPDRSNFTRYFMENFDRFGLAQLISTSFNPAGRGKILVKTRHATHVGLLTGDGDFRSPEITHLRGQADFVFTNPPFSLFRAFMDWLVAGGVKFRVLGPMTSVSKKNIFPLFKHRQVWYGDAIKSGETLFEVPSDYPLNAKVSYTNEHGRLVRLSNVRWFTNIPNPAPPQPLTLNTRAHNLAHNWRVTRNPRAYRQYDNCRAIEVPSVTAIPSDYAGIMGVPITFLDKFCPTQFKILGTQRHEKDPELLDAYIGDDCLSGKVMLDGKELFDRIFIMLIAASKSAH